MRFYIRTQKHLSPIPSMLPTAFFHTMFFNSRETIWFPAGRGSKKPASWRAKSKVRFLLGPIFLSRSPTGIRNQICFGLPQTTPKARRALSECQDELRQSWLKCLFSSRVFTHFNSVHRRAIRRLFWRRLSSRLSGQNSRP